ncbi:MAG: hypothetical protein ACYTBJ_14000, partial [Planctomycetota bacterium]
LDSPYVKENNTREAVLAKIAEYEGDKGVRRWSTGRMTAEELAEYQSFLTEAISLISQMEKNDPILKDAAIAYMDQLEEMRRRVVLPTAEEGATNDLQALVAIVTGAMDSTPEVMQTFKDKLATYGAVAEPVEAAPLSPFRRGRWLGR